MSYLQIVDPYQDTMSQAHPLLKCPIAPCPPVCDLVWSFVTLERWRGFVLRHGCRTLSTLYCLGNLADPKLQAEEGHTIPWLNQSYGFLSLLLRVTSSVVLFLQARHGGFTAAAIMKVTGSIISRRSILLVNVCRVHVRYIYILYCSWKGK